MLWILVFIAALLIGIACPCFLIFRIGKFHFVEKMAHGHKLASWLTRIAIVLVLIAITWIALGVMNALTIVIHLAVFWALAELVGKIIEKCRAREFKRYYVGAAAIIITIAYLAVGWVQAYHVWQTDYTITTTKNVGNLRVAMLADSHVGTTFNGEELAGYVAQIQAHKPDVVVVVGDLVDESTSKENMVATCRSLGKFDVPYGVYFVFGNHDKGLYSSSRDYGDEELIAELEKNDVTVLQDETALIDGRFCLIGRQDASEEDFGGSRAPISTLTSDLDDGLFSIVLDHQPSDYTAEAQAQADLVLSGHTHGGQLIPLVQLMKWFHFGNDSVYGFQQRQDTNFIVTSGISDWAFKFKTGCRSEYVIIDIQGK